MNIERRYTREPLSLIRERNKFRGHNENFVVVDEVLFGAYYENGGVLAEMKVVWIKQPFSTDPAAQLQAYNDSWILFDELDDLFGKMARIFKGITPKEFCLMLQEFGFKNG